MFESIDVDRVAMPANRTRGVRNDSRPRGYLNRQAGTRVRSRALHDDLSMGYPFQLRGGQVRELQGLR